MDPLTYGNIWGGPWVGVEVRALATRWMGPARMVVFIGYIYGMDLGLDHVNWAFWIGLFA